MHVAMEFCKTESEFRVIKSNSQTCDVQHCEVYQKRNYFPPKCSMWPTNVSKNQ